MSSIPASSSAMPRTEIIARRRAFRLPGYMTLADVGLDGDYVSPPQLTSCSPTGPVLLGYHWLDAPTAIEHRDTLKQYGYLKGMAFNNVVDQALKLANLTRAEIFITQVFHLLPKGRSSAIPPKDIAACFNEVTQYELAGRHVVALGKMAANACRKLCMPVSEVPHPSARGYSASDKAQLLARALQKGGEAIKSTALQQEQSD